MQLADYQKSLEADPALILNATAKAEKALKELQREFRVFHFEYVHGLAVSRKLTKEKCEAWEKRAEPQDIANARALVSRGKNLRNLTVVAKPHIETTANLKN